MEKMADLGRDLHRRGYALLLFDLRGHGRSDASRLSMGRRERGDLRAVLAWAGRQGYSPGRSAGSGESMGASTILMEAERNPDIRVAVLDSPFGNLPELLDTQLTKHSHLPGRLQPRHPAGRPSGLWRPHRRPHADPLGPGWGTRPLLLIHGEADSIVPFDQARALATRGGPVLPGVDAAGGRARRGLSAQPSQLRLGRRWVPQGEPPLSVGGAGDWLASGGSRRAAAAYRLGSLAIRPSDGGLAPRSNPAHPVPDAPGGID